MSTTPFFSIVMATYNRAHLIVATIDSILAQEYADFELLVVDDGSTDHTRALLKEKYDAEPRLHYYWKTNEERSIARNFGIDHAKGQYILFFDSDDYMHSDHLKVLKAGIEKHPEVGFYATKHQFKFPDGVYYPPICNLSEGIYNYSILLKGSLFGTLCCFRNGLHPFTYFPPEFSICEDWIFCLSNLRDHSLYFIPEITQTAIEHSGRSMAQNQKVIQARSKAVEYLLDNYSFSIEEANIIKSTSWTFCAIHSFLDDNPSMAWYYWKKAYKIDGFSKSLALLACKLILGKRTWDLLKVYLK